MAALPSILITDDDAAFRETLGGVFEPQGFRVLSAGDGEEALAIVSNQEVHILLLDMHMPILTGLETLRLVKRIKSLLPCILISAEADDSLRKEAFRCQAFSVLSKPVSRQAVTVTVHRALERSYNWRLTGGPLEHGDGP